MEANEYSILVAPVPITSTWWETLNFRQKVVLHVFSLFYFAGTMIATFVMIHDRFFFYVMTLDYLEIAPTKGSSITQYKKLPFDLKYKIHSGLWRNTDATEYIVNLSRHRLFEPYCKGHFAVASAVWQHCRERSLIATPFRSASNIFIAVSILILYFNCFTIVLFRPLMIMLNLIAVLFFIFGVGLLYITGTQWYACVENAFTKSNQQKNFIRSRHFNVQLQVNERRVSILICNMLLFLIMFVSGVYLLCINTIN